MEKEYTVKVNERGQMVIPKEIRDKEVIVYVLQIGSRENFYKTFKCFFLDNMQKF